MVIEMQAALAVVGEPTRFRILQLLAEGPCTVGEVATGIGALQPQTTKHLHALDQYESAGRVLSIAADGRPLFHARHALHLAKRDRPTTLTLEIDVSVTVREAAATVAGLKPGWTALLDRMEAFLEEST
jgi:predicted transcriptional regulator